MKPKIIQLLLVFLSASLFVSSKQNFTGKKEQCELKCRLQKTEVPPAPGKSKALKADYPFALAPGSYIFFY